MAYRRPTLRANRKAQVQQEGPCSCETSGVRGQDGDVCGIAIPQREQHEASLVSGKAALLVPGPSLPTVWHDDLFQDFGVVVGINTTAHKYRVHWAIFSDRHIAMPWIERRTPLPVSGIITNSGINVRLRRAGIQSQLLTRVQIDGMKQEKCAFTMPNALQFCYQFGDVEIFGMDFSNDLKDFAGQRGCHKNDRWKREAVWLRRVWNNDKIKAVHGRISEGRLDWLRGKRKDWPG